MFANGNTQPLDGKVQNQALKAELSMPMSTADLDTPRSSSASILQTRKSRAHRTCSRATQQSPAQLTTPDGPISGQ
jgi:hypothetical protein